MHKLDCNKSYCYTMYLPTQIHVRFPIGGECVTCHGSKLTNSLGKQQLELWTHTWSGRAPWNRNKFVSQPASSKHLSLQFFFFFSIFELRGTFITNHLMTGPTGNSKFCFPLDLKVHWRVSGKQNLLFPLGPVIKCLLYTFIFINNALYNYRQYTVCTNHSNWHYLPW